MELNYTRERDERDRGIKKRAVWKVMEDACSLSLKCLLSENNQIGHSHPASIPVH